MHKQINLRKIKRMSYVELMAFLEEVNRPPGGKDSIRKVVQDCFINRDTMVLDIGCNTGYCAFEIAHLAKCRVIGIDISSNMIKTAKKFQKLDPFGFLIKFKIANATSLPFRNETFDVVISGGSTAFVKNKEKALEEYKRVIKPWGFVVDINFFYRVKPPQKLINKLNRLMGINIQPWDINYWLNLYDKCDLEKYLVYKNNVKQVSRKEIKKYCSVMVKPKNLSREAHKELIKRLVSIMELFNDNHRYLAYGVFILRKRPLKEQISLFGA